LTIILPMQEPLEPAAARALIRTILEAGTVAFSGHALEELGKDDLTTVDAVNVLRGGVVSQESWNVGPGAIGFGRHAWW
jgi:adenosylcobinamide amidohydrolase